MKVSKRAKLVGFVIAKFITTLALVATIVSLFKWNDYSRATFYLVAALYFKVVRIEIDYFVKIKDNSDNNN